jgi:spore photoproduct lyase
MMSAFDYSQKFESFKQQTLYGKLDRGEQEFLRAIAFAHYFTFQEFRQVVKICRDLSMWKEESLQEWWKTEAARSALQGPQLKKHLLQNLHARVNKLKSAPAAYAEAALTRPKRREKNLLVMENSEKKIYGMCPVASEKTVCCNLRTIDAVENCIFGCSYCTIQTFYSDNIVFHENFAEKLKAMQLEPERFYHFGTGQASDALAWGNRHGILEAIAEFAAAHPNVLMELKTKSDNIRYFLERDVPPNIVCSWSLNTPTIIANEEHFTANLEQRLAAARRVADQGIKVAFHFHPLVYYERWQEDYPEIAARLMSGFKTEEVLFISFGSVTLIKPVIQKIRALGYPTKILQAELAPDPHGKLTYADEVKIKLFKTMYDALAPWRDRVFIYLCMEKAEIWENAFGYVYRNNDEFEKEFGRKTMGKISLKKLAES